MLQMRGRHKQTTTQFACERVGKYNMYCPCVNMFHELVFHQAAPSQNQEESPTLGSLPPGSCLYGRQHGNVESCRQGTIGFAFHSNTCCRMARVLFLSSVRSTIVPCAAGRHLHMARQLTACDIVLHAQVPGEHVQDWPHCVCETTAEDWWPCRNECRT